jgi:hypothetical protein
MNFIESDSVDVMSAIAFHSLNALVSNLSPRLTIVRVTCKIFVRRDVKKSRLKYEDNIKKNEP